MQDQKMYIYIYIYIDTSKDVSIYINYFRMPMLEAYRINSVGVYYVPTEIINRHTEIINKLLNIYCSSLLLTQLF
jgi:hypothetical protein